MKLRVALSFVKHRKIESCALGFSLMVCRWKCQNLHNTTIHLFSLQSYTEACDPLGFNLTALQGQAQRLGEAGLLPCSPLSSHWGPAETTRPGWDPSFASFPCPGLCTHWPALRSHTDHGDLWPQLGAKGFISPFPQLHLLKFRYLQKSHVHIPPKLALSLEMRC